MEALNKIKNYFNQANVNFIINSVSFFAISAMIFTGGFVFDKIHGDATFLGFNRHAWVEAHEGVAGLLVICIVIHLFRHAKWFKMILKNNFQGENSNKALLILSVIIPFLIVAGVIVGSLLG